MRTEVVGEDGFLHCSECGQKIETLVEFPLFEEGKTEMRKMRTSCKCRDKEKEEIEKRFEYEERQRQIMKLRGLSLMDSKLKDARFATYRVTEENEKAFELAKKYVSRFDYMYEKGQGLMFYGDVGTGKSYVAAVIANELIERLRLVVMTSFVKLLDGADREDKDFIRKLNQADLLVIDDLGTERSTNYALERVYDIIDSRYRTGKPIIITTNLRMAEMKTCDDIRYNRIYDRIFEMCYPEKMTGLSWRKKEAASRYDTMKKILEG